MQRVTERAGFVARVHLLRHAQSLAREAEELLQRHFSRRPGRGAVDLA